MIDNTPPKPTLMIVQSRLHGDLGEELVRGATAELERQGVPFKVHQVPSLFEIPAAIRYAIRAVEVFPARKRYDGFIALGALIRDGSLGCDLLASDTTHALQRITMDYALALGFGLIAVDTEDQAWSLARIEAGNLGATAARTCLEMLELKAEFKLFPRMG